MTAKVSSERRALLLLTWLPVTLLGAGAACFAYDEPPSSDEMTTAPDEVPCITENAHDLLGSIACDERPPAACPVDGVGPTSATLLGTVLDGCYQTENILTVEFEEGCATRFSLSIESPDAVDCVGALLASGRYDCLGGVRCGTGQTSTLR